MEDSFIGDEGRVDVSRVMAAVRKAIRRRRADPKTPVEAVVAERLLDLAEESGIEPEFLVHLVTADGRWNISPDYRVATHRPGLEGRAVVFLKRLLHPLTRIYTDPIVIRQAQVNLFLSHTVRSLLVEVIHLNRGLADLEKQIGRHDRPDPPSGP
jgi:hypothetical protein